MKLLLFRIDDQWFGVEISSVVEIVNPQKATVLPEAPDYVYGVINLRGEAITIMDMRKRLHLESRPSKERMVIVRIPGEKIGLLVDEVIGIREVDDTRIKRPSRLYRGMRARFIDGIIEEGKDRVIIALNIEKISSEEGEIILKARKKRSD